MLPFAYFVGNPVHVNFLLKKYDNNVIFFALITPQYPPDHILKKCMPIVMSKKNAPDFRLSIGNPRHAKIFFSISNIKYFMLAWGLHIYMSVRRKTEKSSLTWTRSGVKNECKALKKKQVTRKRRPGNAKVGKPPPVGWKSKRGKEDRKPGKLKRMQDKAHYEGGNNASP